MTRFVSALPLVFLVFLSLLGTQVSAQTLLHFTSDPGEPLANGQERTVRPEDGFTFTVISQGANRQGVYINIIPASPNPPIWHSYGLTVTGPRNATLAPGDYPQARDGAQSEKRGSPILDFSVDSIGPSLVDGQFQVLELAYDAYGHVARCAINFIQRTDGSSKAILGQLRFNSAAPISDPAGVVQFGVGTRRVFETGATVTFEVTRTTGSAGPVSVSYTTLDGEARAGADYLPVGGTLNWADGETAPKQITVPLLHDSLIEGEEEFYLQLSGLHLGSQTQSRVQIIDDDAAVTFLHFTSDPTNWVGQGQERTASVATRFLVLGSRVNKGVVDFYCSNFPYVSGDQREDFSLRLANADLNYQPLTVGEYPGALSTPNTYGVEPTLDFGGFHRGGTSKGSFRVFEIEYDPKGELSRFAADFEVFYYGKPGALRGQIRYRSTIPAPWLPEFFNGRVSVGNGFEYLPFLGYYQPLNYPYLYHYGLGFLYTFDAANVEYGAFFYDFGGLGFLYTSPILFPYLYSFERRAFLYYFTGTMQPRVFYDFVAGEFVFQ